jgi:hypothetical protein
MVRPTSGSPGGSRKIGRHHPPPEFGPLVPRSRGTRRPRSGSPGGASADLCLVKVSRRRLRGLWWRGWSYDCFCWHRDRHHPRGDSGHTRDRLLHPERVSVASIGMVRHASGPPRSRSAARRSPEVRSSTATTARSRAPIPAWRSHGTRSEPDWEARCVCGVEVWSAPDANRVRLDPLDPKFSRHAGECSYAAETDVARLRLILNVRDGSGGGYSWVSCLACDSSWQVPHYGESVG